MASKLKADTIHPPSPRMDTTLVDVSLDSQFMETIMVEMAMGGSGGWVGDGKEDCKNETIFCWSF